MSRFGNLEFDAHEESGRSELQVGRGEAHWFDAADAAFATAEFDTALRLYARVLEHNPDSVSAWTGQVRALIELGEFREAKLWADKALERFPTAPELLAAKGVALGRLGDLDTAIAFSDASLEERGDTPYVWLARGDVLLARREKRADYCFERAISLAGGQWLIAWLAARIRRYYRQFAAALKLALQAVALEPGNVVVWLLCGDCQIALGLTDSAQRSFRQALDLDPNCRTASSQLAALQNRGAFSRLAGRWRELFRG